MRYIEIKNADKIINKSDYLVNNPINYKNKWSSLFGNNNPICLELGMGRGNFIINMAKAYPNINFIGLEVNESQMVQAVNKLTKEKLPNLKLINADAKDVANIFGKEIDTIYLTFCDPWPKKQDEKKRFTHESFLRLYDRIFKKSKHIILKTDNKGFFAYSLETLSQYWYSFSRVSLDLHHDEKPIENIMTDFEMQYFKENRPIYYIDAKFIN
ncbi:MAG TPA: tRNA (guanosine(46)-N7)-methyltransferase TrmB [Bacilli bacterium]|nr:tRNA (guanosine(46)-N7)-methyltransferase TrmB [Bacilli bacterium]